MFIFENYFTERIEIFRSQIRFNSFISLLLLFHIAYSITHIIVDMDQQSFLEDFLSKFRFDSLNAYLAYAT